MSDISAAQDRLSAGESGPSVALTSSSFGSNRWTQLLFGVVCMAMVANLQYGWTIFVNPIDARYHWGKAAIQVAFTIFILLETWLVPFEAYLADRFGPRPLVIVGAFLIALCWIVYSRAATLGMLYVGAAIGGIGTGLVYGTCIGNAVKWFQKRRGLAAGLTAAGFGAGAALTIVPLTRSLNSSGYQATLFKFALIQGAVVLVAALALKKPPKGLILRQPNARLLQTQEDSTPAQTLQSWPVLDHVRRLRAGGGQRLDGHRATGAHCRKLQHRQSSRDAAGLHHSSPHVCALFEQSDEWHRPATFRLDVGHHRPRVDALLHFSGGRLRGSGAGEIRK